MAIDRELVLQLAAQRAGVTTGQLEALRRGDYTAFLAEQLAAGSESEATPDLSNGLAADAVADHPSNPGPVYAPGSASADGPAYGSHDLRPAGSDALDAPSWAEVRARVERLSQRLAAVRQQRDAALDVLRQLAAKFGCCPDCWGTEAACATCAGLGSPGHFPPDPHLREWLAPALAAVADAGRDPGVGPYEPVPALPLADQDTLPTRTDTTVPVTSTRNRGER
ncbi:hypothetical protein AB0M64_30115 [Streptomyces sp. NPDC051771]|uniref:hypothetical protein n=1 Tax=Streptomyces sp. NPDC051771 TaxID=3154847 RepID=UPI00344902C8